MDNKQDKILELAKKKDISGMSFREIGRELGIEHAYSVKYHLDQLKKKGLIYFDMEKRKQKVAHLQGFVANNVLNIPIVGSANCGPALELAQEYVQGYLKISKKLVSGLRPEKLVAIKAVGDSLNKADIHGDSIEDGDYVVVDCSAKEPKNGDYVLSIIDGLANFKKFYLDKKKKIIRLVSESTLNIPPIALHPEDLNVLGYLVNGVVVRVIKN